MTDASATRWRQYWSAQTRPLHQSDSEPFYRLHAAELSVLFGNRQPESVLELGCGTGALYPYLGFDRTRYVGVDFSESMLRAFAEAHPPAELVLADASEFLRDDRFDLILSNGVVQYFDGPMFDRYVSNAARMMHPHSVFVCGSVPWASRRAAFASGRLLPPFAPIRWHHLRAVARAVLRRGDAIGHWYEPAGVLAVARRHGLSASIYGSLTYLYRFHAVLRLEGAGRDG